MQGIIYIYIYIYMCVCVCVYNCVCVCARAHVELHALVKNVYKLTKDGFVIAHFSRLEIHLLSSKEKFRVQQSVKKVMLIVF